MAEPFVLSDMKETAYPELLLYTLLALGTVMKNQLLLRKVFIVVYVSVSVADVEPVSV